ncbi:putative delta(24(24))-sterol reductase protein [Phaeoacremonium minimum UCRPA7]|uniref:Delta(24(24(1)))-sterol reductase n=1 Tax=Phaeoacremonium minimum (strain UCR-PA7) TaxID=1286976 RepID=R8BNY6_PHAM7|nr:putative delta(24(24))-sterol reductase protein [Phaeoacremonium minimum UCRPA7]EOO01052.1 putative delta(24(24))-sterol reductase protein [Phaeoacremonium minimum UCRPA7]
MATRYSLRQTPRKKELFDGMVETPGRRSTRRKSQFPFDGSDADGDSSSAAESTTTRSKPLRRRGVPKFVEHIDEDSSSPEVPVSNGTNGHIKEIKKEAVDEKPFLNGNGVAPVKVNGVNGSANGRTDYQTSGSLPGLVNGVSKQLVVDGWMPGKDPKVDYSGNFEFGGSFGVGAMMIGFPILMWYMWIGATFYDGGFPTRAPGQTWSEFGKHLVNIVYTEAFPSLKAWVMYWIFFVWGGLCYLFMPGIYAYGKPLPHEGGKQMKYYCSAFTSLYMTMAALGVLHFTGIFKAYTIIDEFGPLLSVAIISGFIVSFIAYFSAIARGKQHRMTGYPVYDFFMGAELNPRMFGILDFKMFFEVRFPWYVLLTLTLATAARQYENNGYVSGEVMFILMAHYLYANACSKGEELIVSTWDMYYEKWGFMLIFWNMAGVPLSYCHCTLFLANHHPDEYRHNRWVLAAMFVCYLFVYWVWDSCNSQKNRFRAQERGKLVVRKTFPQVPWQTLKNPKIIKTESGDSILVDGWYGLARKVHYACDAYFAINWGLICGFKSPFPWFYPVFFCCMIAHRAWRDIERCRLKYGEAWKEYERQVPYLFIPYVI